jgi:hypothetical protein
MMVKALTNLANLPPYAQAYVAAIESFGFGWRFAEDYRLGTVDKRVQVRDIEDRAPLHEVSKYAQALKRGDQFPPVIHTADNYLVDGATRTEAARQLGWNVFPTFILDVKYSNAPDSVRNQLTSLGAGFNATHGKRMSAANFAMIVDTISVDDDTPKDIARRLHLPESTANTLLNAAKAKHRAAQLGITLNGSLTNSHLKLFGSKSQQFTNPVFAAFLSLTQDAKLTITATTELSKRLAATGTERERLDMLESERRGYRSVIDGGSANPTRAARLRQSLGYLIGQDDPDGLAELDPHASETHIRTLVAAAKAIREAMEAQERVERTRLQEG